MTTLKSQCKTSTEYISFPVYAICLLNLVMEGASVSKMHRLMWVLAGALTLTCLLLVQGGC